MNVVNSGVPAPPKVSDSAVTIEARKVTYEAQSCPKCHAVFNVTALKVGTIVECNACGNMTPRAKQFTPVLDLVKERTLVFVVTFTVGVLSGIAGNYAYALIFAPQVPVEANNGAQSQEDAAK
jgi:hypothetical protein